MLGSARREIEATQKALNRERQRADGAEQKADELLARMLELLEQIAANTMPDRQSQPATESCCYEEGRPARLAFTYSQPKIRVQDVGAFPDDESGEVRRNAPGG